MNAVLYSRIAGAFFTFVALLHVYRLVSPFPIQIGSLSVPDAASWGGVLVAGLLGFLGLRARA
jgi:hypothetical protein